MFFIKNFYAQYFQMQKPFLLFERIMILIPTGYYTLTLIKLQKSKFMPTFVPKNFRENQSRLT